MGRSLLLLFSSILLSLQYNTDLNFATESEYNINVVVKNLNHYNLAGMLVTINYNENTIVNAELTNGQGQVIKQGKWPTSQQQSITILVATQFDSTRNNQDCQGIMQNNVLNFNCQIIFSNSDVLTSDSLQISQISFTTYQVGTRQLLKGAEIDMTIIYYINAQEKQIKLIGQSDDKGQEIIHYWLPKLQAAILLYDTHQNGYWNSFQKDQNNQKFYLTAQNKYQLTFDVEMSSGTLDYIVSGLVLDEETSKPISAATVKIDGKNLMTSELINPMSALTSTDGKFTLKYTLPIFEKFYLNWSIEKPKFNSQQNTINIQIDLDRKVDSYSKDLGTIKLQESLGIMIVSGIITDTSKVQTIIEGAQISIQLGPNTVPQTTTSDKQGKYTLTMHTPVDEKITFFANVKAKGFIDTKSDSQTVTVQLSKPSQVTLNIPMNRITLPITISEIVVNTQDKKPVPNTTVKIISSVPEIFGSKLYNQNIIDKEDGSIQLKFECYETIKFTLTIEYSVPLFVPYVITTPQLDCKDQNLGQTQITLSKETATMTLKGDAKDIESKPLKGLSLTFSSEPQIQVANPKLVTDSNGQWSLTGLSIIPKTSYQLKMTYENGLKESTTIPFKYEATMEKVQTVQFPAIFYQSLIKGSVSGTVSTPQGKVNQAIPITVTCNTLGKDGKPLVIQSKTNVDGTYKVDIEGLGESDKSIDCTVTSGSSPSVQPFTGKVSVSSPKWTGESSISTTYNSIDITIKGLVTDGSKIIKQIEGASIVLTLTPNDVLITSGGKQKLHELEKYINGFRKYHKEQTSVLNTKSGKDGSYSFTFKQVAGTKLSGEISASMELFNAYSKKGIILDGSKTQTINEDIEMDRSRITIKLHSTLLSSDKKAIPGAEIAISKSDPMVLNSKSYNVDVKDDDKGVFVLNFECYKDIEYVSTLKINIPSYVEQNANTPKYKCSNGDIQLNPIEIKLEKITVMTIFSGKIINPYGKGQGNLGVIFSTKPDSAELNTISSADGVWTINDPKISPNEEYIGTLTYKDIEKKDVKIEQKFKIQTANQKISFADINYSDFVNAKITGTITVDKGTITSEITINLSCTPTKSNTKPINIDFKSDNKGQFSQSFQVIGNYIEPIHCTLTTQNGVDQVTQKIDIQQPTYETKVELKSKLSASKLTLTGTLTDQTKLTDKIPNVLISLTFIPTDPLATVLTTKTLADSKYTLEIDIVKGTTYQATITADGTPSFEIIKQNFQIIASQDKLSIVKDLILQRTIIDCTIQASLAGTWNPEANVEITKSIPQMTDNSIYNKPVVTQQGAFKFPFKCYNTMQTTLEMDMWSQVYPKTILPPQEFDCGPKIVNLKPITVSSKSVQITLSGIISDITGITQFVGDAKIEIELTPKDPLATMLTTKSDYNGKYSQIFGAIQGEIYSAIIKVTNDDFTPYTSKPFSIDASKAQEIKENAALDRLAIKASVTSTLLDSQGKPVPQAKISNEELTPVVKGHEKDPITGETDANGKFKLSVTCYKNVKETIILNVQKAEYDDLKTDKQTFICNTDTTITPIKGNLVKTPTKTKLTIKGNLLDPQGKGKGGIPIKFSSEPATNTQEITTASDGKWQMMTDQLQLSTQYTLKFAHEDADASTSTITQSFQTKDLQSNLDVSPIYYADYETVNVNGQLSTSSGLTASAIVVSLNTESTGKDKKPISIQTQTDNVGKYHFQFDTLAKLKTQIKLNLNTVASPKFKKTQFELDVLPPEFTVSKETIVEPTQEYLDQINKYYQEIGLTGQIVGLFKCNDKLTLLPIEGVDISLQQWNGLEYKDMDIKTKTDNNGIFLITTSIYKSQIQNEINVQISKTQYLPKQIMFNPYIYQTDIGQKINIDLQTNELTYLGDGAPCPSKLI